MRRTIYAEAIQIYLDVQVLKSCGISPQEVCRVLGKIADAKQTLHPLEVGPLYYLTRQVLCYHIEYMNKREFIITSSSP